MDILSMLLIFFIIATVIKIATDNVNSVFKPIYDLSRYKLIIAFILTLAGVFGLNMGVMEALKIVPKSALFWFKYFDLVLTALFLTGGAQSIHKLNEAWKEYHKIEVGDTDGWQK